jgi:hypothetical protein
MVVITAVGVLGRIVEKGAEETRCPKLDRKSDAVVCASHLSNQVAVSRVEVEVASELLLTRVARVQKPDEALRDENRIDSAFPIPVCFCDERGRLGFVKFCERNALRLHHLGEDADAAQIMFDRALRVALVQKMSLESVHVISEDLDHDAMGALAHRVWVYVHFWLLRFEEAPVPKRNAACAILTQQSYVHLFGSDANGTTSGAADGSGGRLIGRGTTYVSSPSRNSGTIDCYERGQPNHGRNICCISQMPHESASHGYR